MVKAIWKGKVIAESDESEELENNYYFPMKDVNQKYLKKSDSHTTCPWKGEASYYDVVVDGEVNKDAAWYYLSPSDMAKKIKGHVAFWRGIKIVE